MTVVLGVISIVTCQSDSGSPPEVSTLDGRVSGERLEYEVGTVDRYLGIPFARPPVGELRFRPPQPPVSWPGVREATQFSPRCIQNPLTSWYLFPELESPKILDEDCLYLNVYVPNGATEGADLAVMVWIHGGSLKHGSASQYYGEALAISGGVIVVTINYRLGVMGFFTTGSEDAPGNVGMLDQVMALRWVQDNIRVFGGDPEVVTIFGESAGAWSVGSHMISPLSRGLFKRAITQSGALYSWPVESNADRTKM